MAIQSLNEPAYLREEPPIPIRPNDARLETMLITGRTERELFHIGNCLNRPAWVSESKVVPADLIDFEARGILEVWRSIETDNVDELVSAIEKRSDLLASMESRGANSARLRIMELADDFVDSAYPGTIARTIRKDAITDKIRRDARRLAEGGDPSIVAEINSAAEALHGVDGIDRDQADGNVDADHYRVLHFANIEPNLVSNDLVKGVLGRESIVVMYGASGSTKSFCATEIGLAVASGQPWRGRHSRRGTVVYVAAEGARGMQNRLYGSRQHLAIGSAEKVDFLLVPSVVRLVEETPDVDRFVRTIQEISGKGVDLVIIDTLSQSMPGADENGPKDMTAAIAAAQRIRDELGATVLIVHHSGKDVAKGARGHSSLRAATDTELEVKQDADGLCRVRATKQKEGETGDEWLHRLEQIEIGSDENGDPVTTAIVKPVSSKDAAEITTDRRSLLGKKNSLAAAAVEACLDLGRMDKQVRIPSDALAASGYLALIDELGWDRAVPIFGYMRRDVVSLLVARYEDGDEERRESDEDATLAADERKRVSDKKRNSAKRRIDKAIEAGLMVAHEEWVWMKESERA
jgi:hypothetical protein